MATQGITWFAVVQEDLRAGEIAAIHVDRQTGSTMVRRMQAKDVSQRGPVMDWVEMQRQAEENQK